MLGTAPPGTTGGPTPPRTRRRMPRMGRTLASRILFAVLGIMAVTMAIGLALFTRVTSKATDQQAVEQTRSIAVSLGHVPQVATAVEAGDPDHELRRLAD